MVGRETERIEIVTGGSQVSMSSTLPTGSSFDVTAGYLTGDDLGALAGHHWTLFNPRGRRRGCPARFYSASFSSPFSISARTRSTGCCSSPI